MFLSQISRKEPGIKFQYKRLYLAVQYFTSTVTTYFAIVYVIRV